MGLESIAGVVVRVRALPGVLVYGMTESEARNKAVLVLRVIADRIAAGEA